MTALLLMLEMGELLAHITDLMLATLIPSLTPVVGTPIPPTSRMGILRRG